MVNNLYSLDRLIAFMNVVDAGSMTGAAEHLFLTQPGISRHVKLLERDMGVKLLERSHVGMLPTDAGKMVYEYCKKVIKLLEELNESVSEFREECLHSLRIGSDLTIGKYLLPVMLSGFKAKNPESEISLRIGHKDLICQLVRSGEVQLGLTTEIQRADDLQVEVLCQDQLVIIVAPGHRLARFERVTPEELAQCEFVRPPASKSGRAGKHLDDALAQFGITRRSIMRVDAPEAMKSVVQSNAGVVGILHRLSVAAELQAGTLQEIKVEGLDLWSNFNLICNPSKHQSPLLQLFLTYLREEAASLIKLLQESRSITTDYYIR